MSNNFFKNKSFLITGGTGTFGKEALKYLIQQKGVKKIVLFARDEHKFHDLERFQKLPNNVRLFIGDVRDENRIDIALKDIDYVLHAAALKHVPYAEYNPSECINTNITGSNNVINACIRNKVKKCVLVSTDKAVNPINLYGATKLCCEKNFIASNNYSINSTSFLVTRYGNVVGSRGSLIEKLIEAKKDNSKEFDITDKKMTRFWIDISDGVKFVFNCLKNSQGGEIFVPKMKSMKILDCIKSYLPHAKINEIGVRPGEKIDEVLITRDNKNVYELKDHFVILPEFKFWTKKKFESQTKGKKVSLDYNSLNNKEMISITQFKKIFKL